MLPCIFPGLSLSRSRPCLMGKSPTGITSPASGSARQLSPPLISGDFLTSAGRTRRRSKRPLKVGERQEVSARVLAFHVEIGANGHAVTG